MNKIFILAGNYEQFRFCVKELEKRMVEEGIPFRHQDFTYVTPQSIMGYNDIWGYKFGSWRENYQLKEIKMMLLARGCSLVDDFWEIWV